MTNIELQIVRRSLFLSVQEAVEHIKTVNNTPLSVRAWQMWEKGDRPVPSDVHCEMVILAGILEQMRQAIDENGECNYVYYRTFEEYSEHHEKPLVINWRMEQTCAAELALIDIVDNG